MFVEEEEEEEEEDDDDDGDISVSLTVIWSLSQVEVHTPKIYVGPCCLEFAPISAE